MYKYSMLFAAVVLLFGAGWALAQNADTVDGFDAYSTPHANALLALDGSARMSGAVIANSSIPGSRLVPGAVTAGRLGNNSVTTEKITDGQVMEADLAAGAVSQTKIANGAVSTGKLAPGAVTAGRLADNSVTTSKIVDQAVTGGKLAYGAVTNGRLADNSVTSSKVVDESIEDADIKMPLYLNGRFTLTGDMSEAVMSVTNYFEPYSGNYGVAIKGRHATTSGRSYGVWGQSHSDEGIGVYGWAIDWTGTNYGVYGNTDSPNGYGVYSEGDCYVEGDLTVTGGKTGYVADIIMNGDNEPLWPGDLVEIVWYSEPVVGEIPVAVVCKARSVASTSVLGPIECAVDVRPNERADGHPGQAEGPASSRVRGTAGAVEPGCYGRVVTLGLYKGIKVDASYGPIYPGDLLVSSPTPGCAMASDDPKAGTIVGKALGALDKGVGEIPVFVSSK
jgi:hypothetical protein